LETQGLPQLPLTTINGYDNTTFDNEEAWKTNLQQLNISNTRHIRIATEGALPGTLSASGFPPDLVIISDDAGQFNILLHALCWIHADRVFQRILPVSEKHVAKLEWVHSEIRDIFSDLKQYKEQQDPCLKVAIKIRFDELCSTQTSFATLDLALKRLARNKDELAHVRKMDTDAGIHLSV